MESIDKTSSRLLFCILDLTRQYKTMQTELTMRIQTQEKHIEILQERLCMS